MIEDVRTADTIADESDDQSWTWSELSWGAGSLMNLIILMIKKVMGQSGFSTAARELHEKMSAVKDLLAEGYHIPPIYLKPRQGKNRQTAYWRQVSNPYRLMMPTGGKTAWQGHHQCHFLSLVPPGGSTLNSLRRLPGGMTA